ncbi:lectin-like domain-containing protein [Companilactobacillus kimchiensis]|uniref:Extracellular protein n=1 Tax=Companilactobacillus kimchiensis TaxID=993692 RepID=A0A0R2LE44_9LACO|nr:hypothetical protein [Companilactobacillus kimchiensis]KRN97596.1 extracellular protein [Companilactobacillus kimchiensis]
MNKYKSIKRSTLILLFSILLIIIGLSLTSNNLNAATDNEVTATNDDYEHALKTVPRGLSWGNGDFHMADFDKNNAAIVQSKNPANPDTSIIKMTNSTYKVGGVWGSVNKPTENYFDISHEQIASMWLYFGNTGDTPGDGMAFVLQNDPRGADAIAFANGKPVNGQSLGVWGADWNKQETKPENIAKTAIQNSWALEFDTYPNVLTSENDISGEGVSFDALQPGHPYDVGQHIAGNYPGESHTYIPYPVGSINYFTMRHVNFIGKLNLVDSKWHHLTIKWEPGMNSSIGSLTYSYNDKNPDGTPNQSGLISNQFDVDTQKFNLQPGDTKLYWGFTGSTGKYFENNLMVFESLPSFVDAEATPRVHDNTQNIDIVNGRTKIDPNDDLSYFYNLNYKGWTKDWENIVATMKIPKNVTFSSGTVIFPTTNKTYDIPSSEFNNPDSVTHTLNESLSDKNRNAVIELKGRAAKIATTQLTVPSVHTTFEGDNLITSADTPMFYINSRLLLLNSNSPEPIKVKAHEDVDVLGDLSYADTTTPLINNNMTVHPTLNGSNLPTIRLSDANPATGFKIHLTSSQLQKINTFSFYVTDADQNTTNTITRQINVGGTVSFGDVSPDVNFKNTNTPYSNQIVPRVGAWQVNVIDSREKGSSWVVQAKASDLENTDKEKLNGNLIYKDPTGKVFSMNNNINIANNIKPSDLTQTQNITDTWTSQNGILLAFDSHPKNKAGKYSGTITWSLLDSLQNSDK